MNANQKPHRRYNALTGDWILVSPIAPSARGRANKRAQRVKGVPRTTPSAISVRATSAPVTRKIPYTPPPLLHGLAWGAERNWRFRALAITRAFLSAAAALGDCEKFMVGYEMLGEAQRDLTAELAAQTLRDQSEIHFKERSS